MKDNINLKDLLVDEFARQEATVNGQANSFFFQQKKEAFSQFEELGFPTTRHEEWKYSNVKGLTNESFAFHQDSDLGTAELSALSIPQREGNILYIVNGVYKPELSTIVSPEDQVLIIQIREAQKRCPELLETYFNKLAKNKEEAFTSLNTALAEDGIFIHVPKGKLVEQPIVFRFIADARETNSGAFCRILVAAEENALVRFVESYRTAGDQKSFTSAVTEIHLHESANVEYYKVQLESNNAWHIGTTQVKMLDRSQFYAATVSLEGGFIRNNLNIELDGQFCEAHMYGLYLPNGKQHIDNHTLADHRQPNSYSNELYKGVLLDHSTGVFNGKIFVRPDAQKTNAYQSCKNVVLSPGAKMNTKPQLEIFADDVKCSHGTTTGQLDDEALFYLRSRGIPQKEAMGLLTFAFCEDVLSNIRIDSIREYLEQIVAEKLNAGKE